MTELSNPRKVKEAQAIIRRLCKLQAEVSASIDSHATHAADCFCGDSGFWPLRREEDFRNELHSVEFIERVVRRALRENH